MITQPDAGSRVQGREEGTQDVVLEVPGFLAAQLGASRGWDIPARLRWKLSREPGYEHSPSSVSYTHLTLPTKA